MRAARLTADELEKLRKLKEIVEALPRDEAIAFRYLWEFISVGEIIAEQELRAKHGVAKPSLAFKRIREKGLMERGEGCYNLASWLRPLRKKLGSNLDAILARV